jgi:hypothetical protein
MSLVGLSGLCQWLEQTRVSSAIRESAWAFPIIESVHVLALCLFGMAVLVDLRLLNVTLKGIPAFEVTAQLAPWATTGIGIVIVSGVLTFLNAPVDYYNDPFFRIKVILLLLVAFNAWLFRAGVSRKTAVTRTLSLVLWSGIVIAGRMISYHLLGTQ